MFEFIRTHQKLMLVFLLILIAPAFVLLGVSGYNLSQDENVIAEVGQYKITQALFDNEKRNQIESMRRRSGSENFDPAVFDTPESNQELLDLMITDFLIRSEVEKNFLAVSPDQIQKEVMQNPLFQQDGQFSFEQYEQALSARGFDAVQYEASIRYAAARSHVFEPLLKSHFMSKTVSGLIDDTQLSGRRVRIKLFDVSNYLPQVNITEEQALEYYKGNPTGFMSLEQADVEFVVLSPEAIRARLTVSEEEVNNYFEQNQSRFSTAEQRQARHILISVDDKQSESQALEKAQELKAKLVQAPDQFEALAKQFSQDPGSAQDGGNLGLISPNMMVKEFDNYVFSAAINQISDPIRTEFGYHLIEVTQILPAEVKVLDAVRDEIVNSIQAEKFTLEMVQAQSLFEERVFEIPDSYNEVAKDLGLTVQIQQGVVNEPGLLAGPLGQSAVLAELFNPEALQAKQNTKAIQVNDTLVSARVIDYKPAALKEFAIVRDEIIAQLRLQKAIELANQQAQSLLTKMNQSDANIEQQLEGFDPLRVVSAINPAGLSEQAARAILNVKALNLPTTTVVNLGAQGVLLVWVKEAVPSAVLKQESNPQVVQFYEQIIDRTYNEALLDAAREVLFNRYGVKQLKAFDTHETLPLASESNPTALN